MKVDEVIEPNIYMCNSNYTVIMFNMKPLTFLFSLGTNPTDFSGLTMGLN